jgi:DNA transformation protein
MAACPGCGVAHTGAHPEMPLAQLPNLGQVSAEWLALAGILTVADLSAMGAVEAYRRVEQAGFKPSLNLLYALEGALHDEHWLETKRHRKLDLLARLHAAKEQAPL